MFSSPIFFESPRTDLGGEAAAVLSVAVECELFLFFPGLMTPPILWSWYSPLLVTECGWRKPDTQHGSKGEETNSLL